MDKNLSRNSYKHSIHMPNISKMFDIVNHKTNANQRPTMSFYFPPIQTKSIKKMHKTSPEDDLLFCSLLLTLYYTHAL